ncbi:Myo-inositol catabolism IolB domain protein [Gluconacetobacter diazotrophicus PA1 5]|uniref:5-deoxy-glucuronate isomerase n=1 Tax=Gluconacetobacter diazotrophicus TaxID=33996 RepID=UPI000173D6D4|nr:5-deoxy-glucuronate isomerase [Gluconacetobacter diazotrophicus]ACI52165.1 Myo-inositol catabolism IolB domain protein [Gluconacetobacter diazotrophicus PA1 5]TWB02508.1 5-deoxyglucuronate isomerase [Gluconacetobacter diazotrophicus]
MPSRLLIHPHAPDDAGRVVSVTPQSAGWRFVGFEARTLRDGAVAVGQTDDTEICLVLVSGRARVTGADIDFGVIGERTNPFDGLPWSVYLPPRSAWRVQAQGPVELAICASPARGLYPPRLIGPDQVGQLTRGTGTNQRLVRNILPDTADAETLLVVEVITPGGHWSSYPPHKHDTDDFPNETYLEETYYHRLKRGSGFALQRVYTKDGSLDEAMAIADGDVVLVPKGYHPVGAPHGFDLYYLNVMAGPVRLWKFTMDPDQAHLPY